MAKTKSAKVKSVAPKVRAGKPMDMESILLGGLPKPGLPKAGGGGGKKSPMAGKKGNPFKKKGA